jgi:cytochrome c biogenesis protein CcdA/thiol-disulfide isomerase/thioredoxin
MTLLLISFFAGVLTVLAPCVLPLLPIIVGGSVTGDSNKKKAFVITASLGVSVILFTLALKASTIFIDIPPDVWKYISGGILVAFGLVTFFPQLWEKIPGVHKLTQGSNKALASGHKRSGLLGDIIIGASLGPVFSTCSPTYFIVLATVLPAQPVLGFIYLLAYAAGLSIMLLLIALLGQKLTKKLGFAADSNGWFKKILAIIFFLVGIAILTGFDKKVETALLDAGIFDVTQIEQRLLEQTSPEMMEPTVLEENVTMVNPAPEISTPNGFINTDGEPITLTELEGDKVVLLDIWTYSCINCQRTLPYLNDWYEKYSDQGLEIIGLHTPEFAFEQVEANVAKAVEEFGIKYPVVLDNDYSTWKALGNRYWPRKYLIDLDGNIIYDHIGEGAYEETEKEIQKALKARMERLGESGTISTTITAVEAKRRAAGVESPETYFGSLRNEYLRNGEQSRNGEQVFPVIINGVEPHRLYMQGTWDIQPEYAESVELSGITYEYKAKEVYVVASSDKPVTVTVIQDGVRVNTVTVQEDRLYVLVENPSVGEHRLELQIDEPGVKLFAFTFG